MIRCKFQKWAEGNLECLRNNNISTEFVKPDIDEVELLAKPFIGIINESQNCMGQIIVYKSREMDCEVIDIQTEELLLFEYHEDIKDDIDFNKVLSTYFTVLKSGKRPKK